MATLQFTVKGTEIRSTSKVYTVPSGSVGFVKAAFDFSSDWDPLVKTAVFLFDTGTHYDTVCVDDVAVIPKEVLAQPELWIGVGVYGKDGNGVLANTDLAECKIVLGAPTTGAANTGEQTAADTTLYQQMQTLYAKILAEEREIYNTIQQNRKEVEEAAANTYATKVALLNAQQTLHEADEAETRRATEVEGQQLALIQQFADLINAADAKVKNAEALANSAADQADSAALSVNNLQSAVEQNRFSLNSKVDGAFVEDGYLYLTSNDEVVAGPLGPFSGTGGGGGAGNNAVLTMTNTTGWLARTVAQNSSCAVTAEWSSLENEVETGSGTLTIRVNNVIRSSRNVGQGTINLELGAFLSVGINQVKLTVTDVYGNTRSINFSITVIAVSISSTFDSDVPFTGAISFPYTPIGNIEKTVHFVLDGVEINTATTSVSGRQQTYVIPAQTHGAHALEVYFTAEIDGQTVQSNTLYYDLICIAAGDDTPIIAVDFNQSEISQYTSVVIPYKVYNPRSLTSDITLMVDGKTLNSLTVDRTEQRWTYRADTIGAVELAITCGSVKKEIHLNVTAADIEVEAETADLTLYLSSYGRSNSEANPGVWEYGGVKSRFSGFNFTSDGWQQDDEGITVLRVSGDARLAIPFKPFEKDFRATGKTIELEFSTRDVKNYDSTILSCFADGRGVLLTAQQAILMSEQSAIKTQYKEDEHVRLSFVVEKRAENRLICCYINGILSGVVQYPTDDDFAQTSPSDIIIGSNDCTIDLYCIRVYDNDLTRHQILDNWVADTQSGAELLERYAHNAVYDAYGQIAIDQLPKDLPYLILSASELPQYKGDKKTISGRYVNPSDSSKSFSFTGAEIDVQGTSSQYYARKNYKIKFKGGFVMEKGNEQVSTYKLRADSIPTNAFTFKADVASSEGANNVELVRLYNDICPYQTPPQKENAAVRQGIDGFPIVVFWDDGDTTSFLGKYNFNNDKGTEEVFGFVDGDESWETRNNTSDRVLWKSDDFNGTDWQNDYEGRYPDGNTDPTNLRTLATWLASTDTAAATNDLLSQTVTYDGVQYIRDTAEYRLAKFKNELETHLNKQDTIFYYLFTEVFLMVDSRAKNSFPTLFAGEKWCWLPYDMDTAIGINNEGLLAFDYALEDIDQTESGADVYNGQHSVLWTNLRAAFHDDIMSMYQSLRANGTLSYAEVERRFEEHQALWPEAVFNEDAYFKYIQPLIDSNEGAYLSMCQGSKAEQRKWWLWNRFRYLDSKYHTGDAQAQYINLRAYAIADVTLTPYADIYARVQWGSYSDEVRAQRNQSYTLHCGADNLNDTETMIYSADQLKDIGDLSGLMVGYANFAAGTKLQAIKLGDASEGYSNGNLTELYLGNNTLLRTLDVRNCPNLAQAVDISGCTNIEEVYFDGTSITGLNLPNGGVLKILHLPQTITNLTIRNQTTITDFAIPSYANISTLRLENVSAALDELAILREIPESSRVRLIGFRWEFADINACNEIIAILDTMRGLDENGNNTDSAQLRGTIYIPSVHGSDLAPIAEKYPYITFEYENLTSYCYFYNYDGSQLLYTATVNNGANAAYSGSTPTRASTAQYSYTFAGWALSPNGSAISDALKNVTADRNVYAAFTSTVRKYTVYFYNGSTLLQTVQNVPYGSSATYTGGTPTKTGVDNPEDWKFVGWSPSNMNIQANTSCYAQFNYTGIPETISDSWTDIIEAINDGSYKTKYKVGDTKKIDLGMEGIVAMQIVAMDTDELANGSGGKAPITWVSEQLMRSSKRMNPLTATKDFETFEAPAWAQNDAGEWISKNQGNGGSTASAKWTVTATTAGTISIGYKVSSEQGYDQFTVKVNGETVANKISGIVDWAAKDVVCNAGDTVSVEGMYVKDSGADRNDDTAYIKFSSTGTIEVTPDIPIINMKVEKSTYQEGTGAIGGWEKTAMRAWLKETVLPQLPAEVKDAIKPVIKYSHIYNTTTSSVNNVTSTEDVWIPSSREVGVMQESSGPRYTGFFTNNASLIKKKAGESSANWWWLRSARYIYSFDCVRADGHIEDNHSADSLSGVALGFCT